MSASEIKDAAAENFESLTLGPESWQTLKRIWYITDTTDARTQGSFHLLESRGQDNSADFLGEYTTRDKSRNPTGHTLSYTLQLGNILPPWSLQYGAISVVK